MGFKKCIYSAYPPPPSRAPHTYDFAVRTSLTYPRKFVLAVLQTTSPQHLLLTKLKLSLDCTALPMAS